MSVLSLCIESNDFIISYDYTMLCICTFWTINSNSMAPMGLLDKYKFHCSRQCSFDVLCKQYNCASIHLKGTVLHLCPADFLLQCVGWELDLKAAWSSIQSNAKAGDRMVWWSDKFNWCSHKCFVWWHKKCTGSESPCYNLVNSYKDCVWDL